MYIICPLFPGKPLTASPHHQKRWVWMFLNFLLESEFGADWGGESQSRSFTSWAAERPRSENSKIASQEESRSHKFIYCTGGEKLSSMNGQQCAPPNFFLAGMLELSLKLKHNLKRVKWKMECGKWKIPWKGGCCSISIHPGLIGWKEAYGARRAAHFWLAKEVARRSWERERSILVCYLFSLGKVFIYRLGWWTGVGVTDWMNCRLLTDLLTIWNRFDESGSLMGLGERTWPVRVAISFIPASLPLPV